MTTDDPWAKAEAIAAEHAGQPVKKRTAELPYYFHLSMGRGGVLVHEGRVVTERGVATAAKYLADIGIVAGPGPEAIQVTTILHHLEALPTIGTLDPTTYIPARRSTADDDPIKELQAKVVREDGVAKIVLHYWGSKPKRRGSPRTPQARRAYRATLSIGAAADPDWEVETIDWLPPDQRE